RQARPVAQTTLGRDAPTTLGRVPGCPTTVGWVPSNYPRSGAGVDVSETLSVETGLVRRRLAVAVATVELSGVPGDRGTQMTNALKVDDPDRGGDERAQRFRSPRYRITELNM